MNQQLNAAIASLNANSAAAPAAAARFDLRSTGLSDAQLKTISGAMRCEKTCTVTSAPITKCCWG